MANPRDVAVPLATPPADRAASIVPGAWSWHGIPAPPAGLPPHDTCFRETPDVYRRWRVPGAALAAAGAPGAVR